MVALETAGADLVTMLAAALVHHRKAVADLHPFHRVDAHQRMRQVGVKAIKNRLAEARRHVFRHHRDFGADRVALFLQGAHQPVQRLQLAGVRAEKGILFDDAPLFQLARHVANLRQIAANQDAMLHLQIFFGNRARRDAHRGFTRR